MVLLSTMSFTVEKHYCMGQLANYAILGSAEGCEMHMSEEQAPVLKKVPCCNDIVEFVEGTNSELKIAQEISSADIQFVAIFYASYVALFEPLPKEPNKFRNHSPPLLVKDIQVLYETFLI